MESPPGRRLRRSSPPDGSDLISALSDDMLRLVIARISCVSTIVRTGLLSRRWRGLWTTGLALIIHSSVPAAVAEALLARSAVAPPVSALRIRLLDPTVRETNSLLRAAALCSPAVLVFILRSDSTSYMDNSLDIELPCFDRATSIELDARSFPIRLPPTGDFTSLESLTLKGRIVDIGSMLHRCPRLRTLSLNSLEAEAPRTSVRLLSIHIHNEEFAALEKLSLSAGCRIIDLPLFLSLCPRLRVLTVHSMNNVKVHSTTLQELNVSSYTDCRRIDIMTLALQQLILEVRAYTDLSVSISAPLVEKVMWKRSYTGLASLFGFWSLRHMTLKTVVHQHSRVHVLSLHLSANGCSGAELDFALEMEKILVTGFSTLVLHLEETDHLYGALVSRLLGMHHIRTATQRLAVILEHNMGAAQRPKFILVHHNKAIRGCRNCACDQPKDWRSQTTSLPRLEGVEIEGFNGEHRQID